MTVLAGGGAFRVPPWFGCRVHGVPFFSRSSVNRHLLHGGPSRRTCKNPRVPIGSALSVVAQTTAAGSIGALSRQETPQQIGHGRRLVVAVQGAGSRPFALTWRRL